MNSEIGKYFLFTALGMFLMFIILKILSGKTVTGKSQTTAAFVQMAKTGQAINLIKTNEFKELVKTLEFKNFVNTLAEEQISAFAGSIMQRG